MPTLKRILWTTAAGLFAVGCSSKVSNPGTELDASSSGSGNATGGVYVLDFTGSELGGLHRGSFVNLAFSIDLSQPLREFAFSSVTHQVEPGFISRSDLSGCSNKSELVMEDSVANLEPGDSASVDYVDIEMLPQPHDTPSYKGGACFGYREPGGAWHWNFGMTPVTYDTATDKLRARVPIKQGPVDAVKIIFDDVDGMHVLTTLAFAAKAHPSPAP